VTPVYIRTATYNAMSPVLHKWLRELMESQRQAVLSRVRAIFPFSTASTLARLVRRRVIVRGPFGKLTATPAFSSAAGTDDQIMRWRESESKGFLGVDQATTGRLGFRLTKRRRSNTSTLPLRLFNKALAEMALPSARKQAIRTRTFFEYQSASIEIVQPEASGPFRHELC